ncbi:MAG: sortase [Ruminococcaceae bacterium]|nr:sortase [Oscillospiraceae bacterium]
MSDNIKNEEQDEKKRKKGLIFLILSIVVFVIVASVYAGYQLFIHYDVQQKEDVASSIAATTVAVDEELAENPIDFKSLKHRNNDIYAWLKVPGTKVDYAVAQHSEDDYFYLKHDVYSKQWSSSGAVYAEMGNTNTFEDRVTVLYGHNGYGDSMFTTLHYFEDSDFFKKHGKFYIYMPNRKLTYRIVSAFKFDDRHILNCFDFNNTKVFEDFLKMIQSPDTNNKNVSTALTRELNKDDKIVVLSTCFTNQKSNRYLVCGVLIKDEQTN